MPTNLELLMFSVYTL